MSDKTNGEVYNCASGIRVTILELAEKIKKFVKTPNVKIIYENWVPGDIKVFIVDNSKIRSLGFDFEKDFDAGLNETIDWIQDNMGNIDV